MEDNPAMLELYHHGSSACAAKVRFALEEKALEWTGHYVDILAGEQFSVADITAYCAIRYFRVAGFVIEPDWPELQRWYDAVSARPAAAACTLR